jgi:hypothetical protein
MRIIFKETRLNLKCQAGALFVSLLFVAGATNLTAQTTLSKANKQFELHAFNLAIRSYMEVLDKQPNNVVALERIADCYYLLNRMEEARLYYDRAVLQGANSPEVFFHFGHALKGVEQYELAKTQFLKYAQTYPARGQQLVESCDFSVARFNDPPSFSVKSEFLNTPASDFGPAFMRDQVVIVSARSDIRHADARANQGASNWTGAANNQLFISSRDANGYLRTPTLLKSSLRAGFNEGPVSYSPDGRWVAITKNNFVDGTRHIPSSGMELSIHIAEVTGNGDFVNSVPFPHNGSGFSSGWAQFSPDGRALYFASDRPGGFGGYDIYVSYRVGNSWSTPENLGAVVNSAGNEITPFADNDYLYFSSDGHKGFGGYDVFRAERSGNRWISVSHLGTGINSPRDDYGFIYDDLKNLGYLTSNRLGGKGLEDVYRVTKVTDNLVIQVLNASDRTPVPDAILDFTDCGEGYFETNRSGTYSFSALQGLNCKVVVRKPGYGEETLVISPQTMRTSRGFEVLLRKQGEEYLGTVVNVVDGFALEGVQIQATNQTTGSIVQTTADSRGEYALALSTQSSYVLRYSRSGYVDVNRVVRTGTGQDRTILGTISMTPSSTLSPEVGTQLTARRPDALPSVAERRPDEYGMAVQSVGLNIGEHVIQVAAVSNARAAVDISSFANLEDIGRVYSVEEDNIIKVRVGYFATPNAAREALQIVKTRGYPSAFVTRQAGLEAAPPASELTPRGLATPQAQPQSRSFPTEPVQTYEAPSSIPGMPSIRQNITPERMDAKYMVQLAAYRNPRFFDAEKVTGLGQVQQKMKGELTLMLLSGFDSKDSAVRAMEQAKQRGFTGAYLVTEESGELVRVAN